MTQFVPASVLVVVLSTLSAVQYVLSSNVGQYMYKTMRSVDFPPTGTYFGAPQTVQNFLFCTALCARDSLCRAVYHDYNNMCYLYSQHVADLQLLTPGTGAYAYLASFDTSATPQSYPVGNMLYTTYYEAEETIVAVYSFSAISSWTTLGVLFDREQDQFPQLSTICSQKLYQAVGLSATIVSIIEEVPGSFYRLQVTCQNGETKQGDATCDSTGNWVVDSSFGVACISAECYRVDGSGYARYHGVQSKTRYGTGCSKWENYYYYSYFPHDNNDRVQASNYCRDPDRTGRPWCKIGLYYDYCNVPKCEWQP